MKKSMKWVKGHTPKVDFDFAITDLQSAIDRLMQKEKPAGKKTKKNMFASNHVAVQEVQEMTEEDQEP